MFVRQQLTFSPGDTSTSTSCWRRWSWSTTPLPTSGSCETGGLCWRRLSPPSPAPASARYKLCQLLPRLRASLRLPADKQLLQQLNFCVQKLLCREKDKDVVATIRKVTF